MNTRKRQRHMGRIWIICVVIVLLGSYGYIALFTALPAIKPSALTLSPSNSTVSSLSWPTDGEAAVGILGTKIIDTYGAQTALPTASTAKLLTALCVLHEKPLTLGSEGPEITLGSSDVALYNTYVAEQGSVVPVVSGEQISEYQMLETMMLPSANNMADSLAIWAFGSLSAYSTFANTYVKQLGLDHTHVGPDASGFQPETTSDPTDLVKLGETALENPILAQITAQKTASGIPVAGTIKNVNSLLGVDNIIGIKTGNSNQAGGVFISASTTIVQGKTVTLVTVLEGAPTLYDAMADSLPLVASAQANFTTTPIVDAGMAVGSYDVPWEGHVVAVAKGSADIEVWKGTSFTTKASLQPLAPNAHPTNATVGNVGTGTLPFSSPATVPVVLERAITKPPIWWRLIHPRGYLSSLR